MFAGVSMYRSAAKVHLAIAVSLALLTTAEPASSVKAHTSSGIDEKSINGVEAYAWAASGSALIYATGDGTLLSINGPDFGNPIPIIKIDLPNEHQIEQIVWSADGRNIAVVSPRSNDLWDTIWLVDTKTSQLRDLLPPGAPFGGPGTRSLRISSWLQDGRITFVLHCGTGCLGLHAVQTARNEGYWDFCDASGSFFWSTARKDAVAQNDAEGVGPVGLGLVSASDGVAVANGASYYRPRRECGSVFKGDVRCGTCGPSQAEPHFNSWFPGGETVLYADEGLNSSQLRLWNTLSGSRKTLVAGGSSGAVSPDGRYVCFISPEHRTAIAWLSKRVLLAVLDLRSERIVTSREIPAVLPPVQWSPSMNYLAILTRDSKLLLASLTPDGMQVHQTELTGQEFSWSPDGKYLAVRENVSEPSNLKILKFRSDAARSADTRSGTPLPLAK
jgi:WD40-like Beta Propeller Repeat